MFAGSVQEEDDMKILVERVKRVHDYTKQPTDRNSDEALADTPTNSLIKKVVRRENSELITNATLLVAINKIGERQDSFLEKLQCIEKSVREHRRHPLPVYVYGGY